MFCRERMGRHRLEETTEDVTRSDGQSPCISPRRFLSGGMGYKKRLQGRSNGTVA